jgi:site-specific recombinase XerD
MSPSSLIPYSPHAQAPALIVSAGPAAGFAWDEFFAGQLRNPHTRSAYRLAVGRFLEWVALQGVPLERITPGMVGAYFDQHPGSPPTRKLHLAALRAFFDRLVTRHVLVLNPAASVRGERYQVLEGKTPEISVEQARRLLQSLDTSRTVGLRDRGIIATLIYTTARAGAVARLQHKHFVHDGTQYALRFEEKGGKAREIPVRHDLECYLRQYLEAAGLQDAPRDTPFFRTAYRTSDLLTDHPLSSVDVCRLVKRRLKDAGLPQRLSPHSFRVTTITNLLEQGVPLENVQHLAGHSDPRTTRLYDRRQQRVTRNLVERISI